VDHKSNFSSCCIDSEEELEYLLEHYFDVCKEIAKAFEVIVKPTIKSKYQLMLQMKSESSKQSESRNPPVILIKPSLLYKFAKLSDDPRAPPVITPQSMQLLYQYQLEEHLKSSRLSSIESTDDSTSNLRPFTPDRRSSRYYQSGRDSPRRSGEEDEFVDMFFEHFLRFIRSCLIDDVARHNHEVDRTNFEFRNVLRSGNYNSMIEDFSMHKVAATPRSAAFSPKRSPATASLSASASVKMIGINPPSSRSLRSPVTSVSAGKL
jgi:hypothetical protein